MDQLIRDPLWTFVGVVFALLAVIITVVIYFAQRKKKKLSYEIVSTTQLLGVKEEIKGKVKVLYEGSEVKNVHLLTIKFINTGNVPIASSDYERPLVMNVNEGATVLTHEIINEEPENIGIKVDVDGCEFNFSPVLLNPKDSFTVKALVSDLEGKPKIDGRINGVKSIDEHFEGQVTFVTTTFISMILIAVGAIYATKGADIIVYGVSIYKDNIGGLAFSIGYFLLITSMAKNKHFKRLVMRFMSRKNGD